MNTDYYKMGVSLALSELGKRVKTATNLFDDPGAAALGLIPAVTLGTQLSVLAGPALESALGGVAIDENIATKLRSVMNVPSDIRHELDRLHPAQSHFDPLARVVRGSPTGPASILAHEFGHASGRPLLPVKYTAPVANIARGLGFLSLLGQLGAAPDSPAASALQYGPAALMAPHLIEEGRASLRAMRALKQIAGTKAALRGLASLIPGWGSYAAAAALPIVGGELIEHYREKE